MTSADIVHEFQAYSRLGEKGGGGGRGTLIFSYIRRPGPFLGLIFWCFVMTPKDIHKISIPQKIIIFLKTLKGIEIQNFEPQNGASPRMNENIIVPHPLHPLLADRNRGRGRPDSNNRKNSDKGVFCCFFCNYIWGGKSLFNLYNKTYITCDFSGGGGGGGGGGGVRTTYPSLDPRMGKK